jgi:Protein of unknown function (DUF3632)
MDNSPGGQTQGEADEDCRALIEAYLSEASASSLTTAARLVAPTHHLLVSLRPRAAEEPASTPTAGVGRDSSESGAAAEDADEANDEEEEDYAENISQIEEPLGDLWNVILEKVIHISHDHPHLPKLVDLLISIKSQTPPNSAAQHAFESHWAPQRFWTNLPVFGLSLREFSDSRSPGRKKDWFDEQTGERSFWLGDEGPFSAAEFASLHTFEAMCTVAQVMNLATDGLRILTHALEEERNAWEVERNVPAAAAWILYAGSALHSQWSRQEAEARGEDNEAQGLEGGALWQQARPRLGGDRWRFWRERFLWASELEYLGAEGREMARKAADHMGHSP